MNRATRSTGQTIFVWIQIWLLSGIPLPILDCHTDDESVAHASPGLLNHLQTAPVDEHRGLDDSCWHIHWFSALTELGYRADSGHEACLRSTDNDIAELTAMLTAVGQNRDLDCPTVNLAMEYRTRNSTELAERKPPDASIPSVHDFLKSTRLVL